jgi:hypothetical protein
MQRYQPPVLADFIQCVNSKYDKFPPVKATDPSEKESIAQALEKLKELFQRHIPSSAKLVMHNNLPGIELNYPHNRSSKDILKHYLPAANINVIDKPNAPGTIIISSSLQHSKHPAYRKGHHPGYGVAVLLSKLSLYSLTEISKEFSDELLTKYQLWLSSNTALPNAQKVPQEEKDYAYLEIIDLEIARRAKLNEPIKEKAILNNDQLIPLVKDELDYHELLISDNQKTAKNLADARQKEALEEIISAHKSFSQQLEKIFVTDTTVKNPEVYTSALELAAAIAQKNDTPTLVAAVRKLTTDYSAGFALGGAALNFSLCHEIYKHQQIIYKNLQLAPDIDANQQKTYIDAILAQQNFVAALQQFKAGFVNSISSQKTPLAEALDFHMSVINVATAIADKKNATVIQDTVNKFINDTDIFVQKISPPPGWLTQLVGATLGFNLSTQMLAHQKIILGDTSAQSMTAVHKKEAQQKAIHAHQNFVAAVQQFKKKFVSSVLSQEISLKEAFTIHASILELSTTIIQKKDTATIAKAAEKFKEVTAALAKKCNSTWPIIIGAVLGAVLGLICLGVGAPLGCVIGGFVGGVLVGSSLGFWKSRADNPVKKLLNAEKEVESNPYPAP